MDPKSIEILLHLAEVARKHGNLSEAIRLLIEAVSESVSSGEVKPPVNPI
jgi:hypothetical protein